VTECFSVGALRCWLPADAACTASCGQSVAKWLLVLQELCMGPSLLGSNDAANELSDVGTTPMLRSYDGGMSLEQLPETVSPEVVHCLLVIEVE